MMSAIKMWAAGVGSAIGATVLQLVTSPSATEVVGQVATAAGSWVSTLIVSLGTAIVAMVVTYFSPKNAET